MLLTQIIISAALNSIPLAADTTGISDAFYGLARLIAAAVGGPVAIVLVIEGYQYMFADSTSRGVHLKRAIAFILGGATLVVLGVTAAPLIITAISGGGK